MAATAATSPATDAASPRSDWGQIVQGKLANGVRFAILPRRGSEPGAALLMRNEGGFIAERRPGERGLAHLIEHVFLVSPTTGAPAELDHFKRIGVPLTLPAPSVGTTSWRETNYFLSTRTTRPEDLDTLLALFRESVSDLTFRADAVDGQRADVMREMAGRKPGNDVYAHYVAAIAPGSPNDLLDAQNSDDVPTASVATIRGLYRRLYRPENIMIVVVGNVDPARTAALIEQRFGGWRADTAAPRPSPPPRLRVDRIRPVSFAARADGRRAALMTVVMPTVTPPPSRARQAEATLRDMLAVQAARDRLTLALPEASSGKSGAFIENGDQGFRQIMVWNDFPAGQWQTAVAGVKRTICALTDAGLSDAEWQRAKAAVLRDLEQRAQSIPTVANVELAKDLSHAVADGRALIPPDELLAYARRLLPSWSARANGDWWRRQWRRGVEQLRVEAPELGGVADPPAAIRAAADAAVTSASCKVPR